MVQILEYKKIIIVDAVNVKLFSGFTVSYIIVSMDDVLNNINDDEFLQDLKRVFKETFEIKTQEGSVLKYFSFRISQYRLGLDIDQTDHLM